MYFQTPGSGTATQLPPQTQHYLQNQAVHSAAQVAQSLQHHLQKTYVPQQNQTHPTFSYYKSSSHPHPHQSEGLEGYGHPSKYKNNSDNVNKRNNHTLRFLHQNEQKSQSSTSPTPTTPSQADVQILLPEPPSDETLALEELENFALTFRRRRISLGYTQFNVGLELGKLYGNDFSQTTVSRFEALNLSFKNMCKLKPMLQKWIEDKEKSLRNPKTNPHNKPEAVGRRRKKRTSIEYGVRIALENAFMRNIKPNSEEIEVFAEKLDMDKEVIRIWFCNRRQKEKRLLAANEELIESTPPLMFPQHSVFGSRGMSLFGSSVAPLSLVTRSYGDSSLPTPTAGNLPATKTTSRQ